MEIHTINVDKISRDEDFRFTSSDYSQVLEESISTMGIVNPIYLISREKNYQILAGFKRFRCALDLGLKTIPARMVKPDNIPEHFRNLILEHLSYHTLNIMEKSRIIKIFTTLGIDWQKDGIHYLKIIDIPFKKNVIEQVRQLLELSEQVQGYIELYDMSLKQTEIFQNFSAKENRHFINLAMDLGIRSVELSKIMTLAEDIAGAESFAVIDIFNELKIFMVLESEKLSKSQKIKEITQRLQQRRYAKLTRWNDQLEQLRKKLKLPHCMQVSWDTSLEKAGINIYNHINSLQDIESLISFFSGPNIKDNFKNMLDIV